MTGSIVTFSDAIPFTPIDSIAAQIEPVQDLHGYENPWPAGGGINKFSGQWPPDVSGLYGGWYTGATTQCILTLFDKGNNADISGIYFGLGVNGTTTPVLWAIQNGEIATTKIITNSTDPNGLYPYVVLFHNTEADLAKVLNRFDVMVTIDGVESSTFSPYENICPISGHTGAEIEQTGVNLFPDTSDAFRILGTSAYAYRDLQLPSGTHLYLTVEDNDTSVVVPAATGVGFISKDTQGQNLQQDQFTWIVQNGNITTRHRNNPINGDTNIWLDSIFTFPSDQENLSKILKRWKFTLNIGDVATPYEPYTSNQISVTFPSEAGTVYGGEDEVISGKLTSNMDTLDLGELNYTYMSNAGVFRATNVTPKKPNVLCECYKTINPYIDWERLPNSSIQVGSDLIIRDDRFTDVAALKAALSGVLLYYEVQNPTEYTLEGKKIATLYGTNNIWADTGNVTVTYIAKSAKFSFGSPLHTYNYNNLKLFGNTYIEHGKG